MSRRTLVIVAVAAAVIVGGGLAAALSLTAGSSKPKPAAPVAAGADRVATMLRGIPQKGTALGSATAPVTLVEFADLQCPYCGEWARTTLPTIVRDYVRPGKVRILFNGMAFVGPDSETALRTALAAAEQQRFWNVLELLFENQGTENTGWVTDSLLRSIGNAVPGLDTEKMLRSRDSTSVGRALSDAAAFAQEAGIDSTPTFAVGKTGGQLEIVRLTSLGASGIEPALDAALSQ